MSCETFQHRLQDFLDGKLGDAERAATESHVAACPSCRDLLDLLRLAAPADGAPDLAPAVLQRTTGTACERARDLLCDRLDVALDAVDASLLAAHAEHCDDCAMLGATLTRLAHDLPAMAVLTPPRDLVAGVLAATTHRPPRWTELAEWIRQAAAALLARPRIAWEAGYVGALGVWLAVSLTGGSIEVAASLPETSSAVVERVTTGVGALGRGAWEQTGGRGLDVWQDFRSDLTERYQRTTPMLEELRRDGLRLKASAIELDVVESGKALKELGTDARAALERFASDPDREDETEPSPRGD